MKSKCNNEIPSFGQLVNESDMLINFYIETPILLNQDIQMNPVINQTESVTKEDNLKPFKISEDNKDESVPVKINKINDKCSSTSTLPIKISMLEKEGQEQKLIEVELEGSQEFVTSGTKLDIIMQVEEFIAEEETVEINDIYEDKQTDSDSDKVVRLNICDQNNPPEILQVKPKKITRNIAFEPVQIPQPTEKAVKLSWEKNQHPKGEMPAEVMCHNQGRVTPVKIKPVSVEVYCLKMFITF